MWVVIQNRSAISMPTTPDGSILLADQTEPRPFGLG